MEHAYLVARGIRPLTLVEALPCQPCPAGRDRLEEPQPRLHPLGSRPRRRDSELRLCASAWVLDLYEWAVTGSIPEEHRERILGLLLGALGHSTDALSEFEAHQSGRRFATSALRASSPNPFCSLDMAEIARPLLNAIRSLQQVLW